MFSNLIPPSSEVQTSGNDLVPDLDCMADVRTPSNPSQWFSVWFDEPSSRWKIKPCWSRLGGFAADCWPQLIRKQRNVVVCIQNNPRRYKIDKNKSVAVPEDAGHDLPCWWLNFEFLQRRRYHVLSAVAKTRTPLKYTWTRQTVILKHCSKSVMNFSTGNTFLLPEM